MNAQPTPSSATAKAPPCPATILGHVIPGSVALATREETALQRYRGPVIIAVSLGVLFIVFSLVLKASTALIGIPPYVWKWVSGVLLLAYVIGLSGTLLMIAILGRRAVAGARWAADPHGWFRRGLGAVFVVIGVLVLTGRIKAIETWLVLNSPLKPWNLDQEFIPTQ